MSAAEISKADVGPTAAIVKSKKYGIAWAFASACFAAMPLSTSPVVQTAALVCGLLAVLGYLAAQAHVDAAAVRQAVSVVEDEDPEPETVTDNSTRAFIDRIGAVPPETK